MMVDLSHYIQCDVTSLFWLRHFCGYIEYTEATRALEPRDRYNQVDQIAGINMLQGVMTPTGETYKTLLLENTPVDEDSDEIPMNFYLGHNYPNPFNRSTLIPLQISNPTSIEADIYDLRGRKIRSLISDSQAGSVILRWDGLNEVGQVVPTGVYVVKVKAGSNTDIQRISFIK